MPLRVHGSDGSFYGTTSGGGNAALKLWDTESWQEVLTLEGEGPQFLSSAFSPDGSAILAVNRARIVHIWRAPSWEEINAAEKPATAPGPWQKNKANHLKPMR